MAISFIEAQRLLGEATGSYRLMTTTAAGTTTTIVDTGLQDLYLTDTALPTIWVRFRTGIEAGQIRRFTGVYTFSTGTATMSRALVSAPGIAVDYELWTINPTDVIAAIKKGVAKLYPVVHRRLVDTSIIVNDILDNSDFSDTRGVLSFDGDSEADDLVTVTDHTTIDDIFGTGGAAEWKDIVYSDGENDLGFVLNKVQWSVGYRDEEAGYVRMEFTVAHDTTNGVWMTADRCRKLGELQVSSLRHNTDDVANDPEYLLDGVRQVLIPTSHPLGTVTTDNGSDLIFGNIAAATRTLDGDLHWIRFWDHWRSDREITENLDSVLTGHEIGLIGLWTFEADGGATVYDLSVSQNNGTITSASWTTDIPHWPRGNTLPNVTIDRSKTFGGKPSVKVVASASGGQLTQIPIIDRALMAGKTVRGKRWVWTDGGSQARLKLDWDGSSFENGDYHDGNSEWQLLTVEGQVPNDATQVKVILDTAANATAYWSAIGFLDIGGKTQYAVPLEFETLNYVTQQATEDRPLGNYLPFADPQRPTPGRILKLEGKGRTPTPDHPEDLLDLNDKQMEYLVALASFELYQTLERRTPAGTPKDEFRVQKENSALEVDILSRDRGVRSPSMSAEITRAWHIERTGVEGMTLVFGS